jgi:hypothetical protein
MRVLAVCLAMAASGAAGSAPPSADVVIEARLTYSRPALWAARSSASRSVERRAALPALKPPLALVGVGARGPTQRLFLLHRALLR